MQHSQKAPRTLEELEKRSAELDEEWSRLMRPPRARWSLVRKVVLALHLYHPSIR
jgi:hypothetical protein